jgi:hypothetical protein
MMFDDLSADDRSLRLPDQILEVVRRHAENPELAAYSLRVGSMAHPDWPDDRAAQVEVIDNMMADVPPDVVDEEGRAAIRDEVAAVYRHWDEDQ